MAKSLAVKRLERLLDNEEYGPKLVRISKASRADEARVLDLIDRNVHYTKVHREIDRLDEQRRATVRARRSRKTTPKVNMQGLQASAIRNIINQVGNRDKADHVNIRKRVKIMDMPRLTFATTATANDIINLAQLPEDEDTGINPFWYH